MGEGHLQIVLAVLGHILVIIDGHHRGIQLVSDAFALSSLVGIRSFSVKTPVLNEELERIVHEAAVAALVVLGVAVDQLLLRERLQFPRVDLINTLDRTGRRESPAASAFSLILDRRDRPFPAPIDGLGNSGHSCVSERIRSRPPPGEFRSHVRALELFVSQIRELVQPQQVAAVSGVPVVLVDVTDVVFEDLEAQFLLAGARVQSLVLRRP
ncbi:hypothetical protein Mapa_009160 [Marchantia paleacea]|nr:hypothetical protein Mapa_009160 [Marchantia paleacea]